MLYTACSQLACIRLSSIIALPINAFGFCYILIMIIVAMFSQLVSLINSIRKCKIYRFIIFFTTQKDKTYIVHLSTSLLAEVGF